MSKPKMTPAQQAVYEKLSKTEWKTAYDLGCSVRTLSCLVMKGYAESKSGLGAMAFPRTSIDFRAT
jgi:hypothetical protein